MVVSERGGVVSERGGAVFEQGGAVSDRGGVADVLRVLCLMQAAFLLLAGLGEVLMMGGNVAYLVAPVAKMVLLLVVVAKVAKGRRWATITLIVVQAMTLVGLTIQQLIGLLPGLDYSVNLVGLVSNLALPVTVIYLCALLLDRGRKPLPGFPPVAYGYPVPVDPYAPAELVR